MAYKIRTGADVKANSDYRRLYNPAHAWGDAISMYLGLPQLRGFWPMSSVNEVGNVYDLSGQGRTVGPTGTVTQGVDGLVPYTQFDGTTGQLTRSDEAATSITGALTLGCWVYFDSVPVGSGLIGKWTPYAIYSSGASFRFAVFSGSIIAAERASFATGQWLFAAGRYTPSTELKLWYNNETYTNTTSIPASIADTAVPFGMGRIGIGYFPGRITLAFLCAAALSDETISTLYDFTRPLFGV